MYSMYIIYGLSWQLTWESTLRSLIFNKKHIYILCVYVWFIQHNVLSSNFYNAPSHIQFSRIAYQYQWRQYRKTSARLSKMTFMSICPHSEHKLQYWAFWIDGSTTLKHYIKIMYSFMTGRNGILCTFLSWVAAPTRHFRATLHCSVIHSIFSLFSVTFHVWPYAYSE